MLGAFLAADGLTGTRRTLEGNAGLFALYERGEVKPEILFDGLGSTWRTPEYSFKPYPCCRCNHTPIGLGIGLHGEGVRAEDVEGIEIRMGNVNWLTVGEPYDVTRDSVVHAQFNAAYSFARALADGRVDLQTYQKPAISDPRIVALTRATNVISDPAIEATAIEPARVKVTLKSGRAVEAASEHDQRQSRRADERGGALGEIPRVPRVRAGRNTAARPTGCAERCRTSRSSDDAGRAIVDASGITSFRRTPE